jgi:hypothetical protein
VQAALLLPAFFLVATPASAASTEEEVRIVSADPDAPSMRYGWAGALHGRMSVLIPIVGSLDELGWLLLFQPLLEIHNFDGSPDPVPHQFWRGRATLELSDRWALSSTVGPELAVGLVIEHESAHKTVRAVGPVLLQALGVSEPFAFQYENSIAVRAATIWPIEIGTIFGVTHQRLHFATCTIADELCDTVELGGVAYDFSFELGYDSGPRTAPRAPGLHFFGSALLQVTLQTEKTAAEQRFVLATGLRWPTGRVGELQLTLSIQRADVGIRRSDTDPLPALYLGWAP